MGLGVTVGTLGAEEIREIRDGTKFSSREVKHLYNRFKNIDRDHSGYISRKQFMQIPELAVNPIAPRVISVFDVRQDNRVNFKDFVMALHPFSHKASRKDKLLFAFRVYDVDDDGYISEEDLTEVLTMMVGRNLEESEIENIVKKTIGDADKTKDGRISQEEFEEVFDGTEIEKKLSIRFDTRDVC